MKIAFLVVLSLLMLGCDALMQGDCIQIDKSKQMVISIEEYQRLKAAETEAETLRAEAAFLKDIGRYQLFKDGPDTWRFDTATGQTCLALAPEATSNDKFLADQFCTDVLSTTR